MTITFGLVFLWTGCLCSSPVRAVQDDQPRPRILILGDSISIGYTPFVRQQLEPFAEVIRPARDGKPENCSGTTHATAHLDRWLTEAGTVDLVFFNFGLHDLKRVDPSTGESSSQPGNPRQAEPEVYRRQLASIVERLKATRARLVLVTTTPVPPGCVNPWRDTGDPLHYNAIARNVAEQNGIGILDLYAPAAGNLPEWQRPANVHFFPAGSEGLAKLISARARGELGPTPPVLPAKTAWRADPDLVARLSGQGGGEYREGGVPDYELPGLFGDGPTPTAETWPARRRETAAAFASHVYGRPPDDLANAVTQFECDPAAASPVDPRILVRSGTVRAGTSAGELCRFPFLVFQPAGPGPFPAIVLIHNREMPDRTGTLENPTGFFPVSTIVEKGFAVAVFYTGDVEPDRPDPGTHGVRAACDRVFGDRPDRPEHWGALAAWAWGASRVVDFLAADHAIDPDRIAVMGHSRGGKAALWAAAVDVRFAAAIANQSGCGGAALSRRKYGETIGRITGTFPHWFAPRLAEYAGREESLPVDQHQLLALIAPRAVCIGSASEDLWADPRGEYLSLAHAAPVWKLFGHQTVSGAEMPAPGEPFAMGPTCYHIRSGSHGLHEGDWLHFLTFLQNLYGMQQPAATRASVLAR